MSFATRLIWDETDVVIRDPTADEMHALRDPRWEPPTDPPPLVDTAEGARIIQGDDVTAEVHEHGELGPVLTNADHNFAAL